MAEITYKDDHVDEAVARLAQILQDAPRLVAFLRALADPTQDLEDVFRDLRLLRRLDTAQGEQLNVIGRIVGLVRDGLDDDAYRARLRAWLLALDSSGTMPQLIAVLEALFPDAAFTIQPRYPAAFEVLYAGALTVDEAEAVAYFLARAKAAGVGVQVVSDSNDLANAFLFADGDAAQSSTTQGFADSTTPTTGGFLSRVEVV